MADGSVVYDPEITPTIIPSLISQENLTKIGYNAYGMANMSSPVPYELLKTLGIANDSVAAINQGDLIGG